VQSAQSAFDSAQKFYDSQKALFALGGIAASALDTAASQLSAAQANLEGAKTALDQNNKSGDQTIAQLKLAVTQAQNQLVQAQLNLQYASIRAPFYGQIASINMQTGMYVGLNTPAFTLVSADREISFSIPPSDAPTFSQGSKIVFSYNGANFPVRVSQAPSAPVGGVVPMVASVPASFKLSYGTVGSVAYIVTVASGILAPLPSLATLEDKNYVFAIVDGKATRKDVTIIGEAGITAAVVGLVPGDVVIVSPPPGLIQGSQVEVVAQQQAGATAAPAPSSSPGAGQTGAQKQGSKGASGAAKP
jgi:multidrug efflux pump subunit AcrA (membrane-fusion protein)